MSYFGFELRNNSQTRVDHVVTLLNYAFGIPIEEAFELAMKVHKSGKAIVAVCEEELLDRIQNRLHEANAKINHPVDYGFYPVNAADGCKFVTEEDLSEGQDFDKFLLREKRLNIWFLLLCGAVALAIIILVFWQSGS